MTPAILLRAALVPLYLFACLMLGGSTRSEWLNMVLQLGAIAFLAWSALAGPRVQSNEAAHNLVRLAAILIAVVLIQLIPLPPALWTVLPGRGSIVSGFGMLGLPPPWLPLSIAPYDTLTTALWLLPPFAVLAGMLRLGAYRSSWIGLAIVIAGLLSVLLGTFQFTGGAAATSPWYLYSITNDGPATGFFANANHLGTLLLASIPFVVALYEEGRKRSLGMQVRAGRLAIVIGVLLILVTGLIFAQSLAADGLAIPVAAACFFLRADIGMARSRRGLAGAGLLAIGAVIAILLSPIPNNLTAPGAKQSYSSRYTSFANSLRATADFFPIGSGIGSFPSVYPAYEDDDVVDRWYVNHVHSDYIELVLETGLPGLLLIIALLAWWAGRTLAVWRAPVIDLFGRTASIASGAILAHSAVDFPLRTSAIAALFVVCLVLMAGPRRKLAIDQEEAAVGNDGARHLSIR